MSSSLLSAVIGLHLHRPTVIPKVAGVSVMLAERGAQHRRQFHHIFPKAILKGRYSIREADDIGNLAFVGGETNRQISDKAPEHYFADLVAEAGMEPFSAQCIPKESGLARCGRIPKISCRSAGKLISGRLNSFLQETSADS